MTKKIITMGEMLLRVTPPDYHKLKQTDELNRTFGGGEANVAVALSNYGLTSHFVTRVPNNRIGDNAIAYMKNEGVETRYIQRGGERLGLYFVEPGASMRPSRVTYDRKYSSIAEVKVENFDLDEIFKGADWFHLSGITPALSDKAAQLTIEALKAAKRHGVTVSFDINYRQKLWTLEKARHVLQPCMAYVDVFIGSPWDVTEVLGIAPAVISYEDNHDNHTTEQIFKAGQERFGFKYMVSTLRERESVSFHRWAANLYDGKKIHYATQYDLDIVDRIGGGDAFVAGLIYGLTTQQDPLYALEFGVAASALKHTIPGDFNLVDVGEVEALLKKRTGY